MILEELIIVVGKVAAEILGETFLGALTVLVAKIILILAFITLAIFIGKLIKRLIEAVRKAIEDTLEEIKNIVKISKKYVKSMRAKIRKIIEKGDYVIIKADIFDKEKNHLGEVEVEGDELKKGEIFEGQKIKLKNYI